MVASADAAADFGEGVLGELFGEIADDLPRSHNILFAAARGDRFNIEIVKRGGDS